MIDEKRVTTMAKMEIYNRGEKRKDMIVCSYYKRDYVILQSILSGLWCTLGYLMLVGIYLVFQLDYFTNNLSVNLMLEVAVMLLICYVVILVIFEMIAIFFYNYKYKTCLKSARVYYQALENLNTEYKKEN